ncbi:Asp-tRNAAsn/Glu-tRNAGln amidotransferase A subunit or related amidase (plasmid) [Halalkaliarchaeum sp. AArc-CO]|uniref:amidase n=1 Tax=Halalkaliarchaeum sp. AArc-CO TaxID=2866381 RepID=UPI00217D9F12|nr:amidase [Halalkaliarchaeum sp. AArc-CO]UWG49183.1 Asp-tRNAAsn/Glu-tRNAGln amidotransferase A subunit or related amidase [Halalkaliarchaeum sp. AArc-CO]
MLRTPSERELAEIAESLGIDLSQDEISDYHKLAEITFDDYETIQETPEPGKQPTEFTYGDRTPGKQPEENPHNMWITKAKVETDAGGLLKDKRIGLKDNIALAGVEMTSGSRLLKGYIPDIEATVVQRLLEAGGTIAGKLNMDEFGFSASGDYSGYGPVTNPWDDEYLTGGSSSGCGAALAAEEVDIAVGADQGGSIRIPAAWCGVVGLSPTTGLIPYTGVIPMDASIDHVGPMARSVREVAEALTVMAGTDGIDPRQPKEIPDRDFTTALEAEVSDLTIAVLEEGFSHPESDPKINDKVHDALARLEEEGASVSTVSIPMHLKAPPIALLIWSYGGLQVLQQGAQGSLLDGWYNTKLSQIFSKSWRSSTDQLTDAAKATLLAMEYLNQKQQNTLYAKAQNLSYALTDEYANVLADADVIAMPTVPTKPLKHNPELDRVDKILRTFPPTKNTCPFVLTGHPSITVPAGTVEGLPVGMMFVGNHFEEDTLLRIAYTLEEILNLPQSPESQPTESATTNDAV